MSFQNCLFGYPDYVFCDPRIATVAFSGGSWLPSLPLSNLTTLPFAEVARSTDLAPSSTQLWVDLGVIRDVRVIAIPRSNGSRDCMIRVRAFDAKDSSGAALTDSGWRPLYPVIYPAGSLRWGHPSLWNGLMSAEDALVFPMPFLCLLDQPIVARWWLIEIDDQTNPAGYFQLPRVVLAQGWQPSRNFGNGMSILNADATAVQTTQGGADYFAERPTRRIARFSINVLPKNEALAWANDMQLRLGISGQVYFVANPGEPEHMHRRAFLARMTQLSPLAAARYGSYDTTYELTEIVA